MKRRKFQATARLELIVTTGFYAESLEDALRESRTLREHDFVKIPDGEYQDGTMRIISVTEDNAWQIMEREKE